VDVDIDAITNGNGVGVGARTEDNAVDLPTVVVSSEQVRDDTDHTLEGVALDVTNSDGHNKPSGDGYVESSSEHGEVESVTIEQGSSDDLLLNDTSDELEYVSSTTADNVSISEGTLDTLQGTNDVADNENQVQEGEGETPKGAHNVDNTTTITSTTNSTFGGNNTSSEVTSNATTTTATTKPSIRWPCNPISNLTTNGLISNESHLYESLEAHISNPSVFVVNNESLLGDMISTMNRTKVCALLLFYSPYCEFCTKLAPLYNVVGRSYKDILVLATDAQNVMGVSAKYGIVGIPTVLLFHSGKAVAKYNRSRTLDDFRSFLSHLTGVQPTTPLNRTQADDMGPLSSELKESKDYYLIFSIGFICFVVLKGLAPFLWHSTVTVWSFLSGVLLRTRGREKLD